MLILLIALVALPLAEIYLLIEVGSVIGAGWTILAIIATAVIGGVLIRRQGMGVYREAQAAMSRDELPLKQIFDGFFLLIAGVLLFTPGFVTDTVGFLLLVPPIRALIGWRIWQWLRTHGSLHMERRHRSVDASFREVHDDDDGADRPAGSRPSLPPISGSKWGRDRNHR